MRISETTLKFLSEEGDVDAAQFLGEDAFAWTDGLEPGVTLDKLFEMGQEFKPTDVGWREDFCRGT